MEFLIHDFSKFTHGDDKEKELFGQQLVQQLESCGFTTLYKHGISEKKVEDLFNWSHRFFDLPFEDKNLSKHPPEAHPHRGYSRVGQENLSALNHNGVGEWKLSEVKEIWDQGASDDESNPNQWGVVEKLPEFRSFMESSFEELHNTAIKTLEAIALGLGLPRDHFEQFHTNRAHEFRLIHYPKMTVEELLGDSKTRTGQHTDWGTITLLFQDGVGGLEAEDQSCNGIFHPVTAAQPIMVVNVGDAMQRWTNGRLKSAMHRVTVPSQLKGGTGTVPSRYSIAFFCKPNRDASLAPFPMLLTDSKAIYEENITAGEYNMRKQVKVY